MKYFQKKIGVRKVWQHGERIFFLLVMGIAVYAQVNWSNIGPGGGSDLWVITFQPDTSSVIYVGGDIEGLFKSTDGGQTWNSLMRTLAQGPYGANVYFINDMVIHPQNHQILYLCTGAGLFQSSDGGQTWSPLYFEMLGDEVVAVSTIAIDPTNPNQIYMGLGEKQEGKVADFQPYPSYSGKTGLFKTTDGGTTWDSLNVGMPDSTSIHSIVLISDTVIIATTRGVYRSDDGGLTWAPKNNGLPHTNVHFIQSVKWKGQNILFLTLKTLGIPGDSLSFRGGIFKSEDYGETWIDITTNLPRYDALDSLFYDYWKFSLDPNNEWHVLVSPARGSDWNEAGIYETWDADSSSPTWDYLAFPNGQGWIDTAWYSDPYAHEVTIAPSNSNVIAYSNVYVMLSQDGGSTFSPVYTSSVGSGWRGNGLELMNTDAIAFDPSQPDRIYIGYDDMGLFRSDDDGASWIRLDPKMSPQIGTIEGDGVKEIKIDPANGDLYISRWGGSMGERIYNYTNSNGGIVFSSDNGVTQVDITNGAFFGRCDIELDVQSGSPGNRILYAAVYHDGVYKTQNSGGTWSQINTGLGSEAQYAWEIVIDPNNAQSLWLGLNHQGGGGTSLYHSTDGGQTWNAVTSAPSLDIFALKVTQSGRIFLAGTDNFDWPTTGGLYVSSDSGQTWQLLFSHPNPVDFAINPQNENVIALAAASSYRYDTNQVGIYLTLDGGQTWQLLSQSLPHTFFNVISFDPFHPSYLYVGTGGNGIWKSDSLFIPNSIEEFASSTFKVFVYPIPALNYLNVNAMNVYGKVTLTLFSIDGEEVWRNELNVIKEKKIRIDMSKFSSGVYMLVTEDSRGNVTVHKVIK